MTTVLSVFAKLINDYVEAFKRIHLNAPIFPLLL
jgi:hypothetical protein